MPTCIRESGSTPYLAIMGENRIGMLCSLDHEAWKRETKQRNYETRRIEWYRAIKLPTEPMRLRGSNPGKGVE